MSRRRVSPFVARALATAVASTVAPSAWAQEADADAPVAQVEATPRPAESGELLGPDGTYTIRRGDTLWDLAQQFLNNPWYWPKIWADNPYVENPHWIYPGNPLLIRPGADAMPTEVEPWVETEELLAKPKKDELADFSRGTFDGGLGEGSDLVSSAGRFGLDSLPKDVRLRTESLVTARELAESGEIVSSFEQKQLLSVYDRAYLSFKDLSSVRVGDTYSIFRAGDEVRHPVTGRRYGFRTLILGTVRIVGKDRNVAIGQVEQVNDYIERGDRIGPAVALEKLVTPVANTADVRGVILATAPAAFDQIGEYHVVFIDKGSRDGVVEGNTFTVYQSGDGLRTIKLGGRLNDIDPNLPAEPVATLIAYDVREDSCAAYVARSAREVNLGDVAEMRATPLTAGAGGDVR